MRRAISLGAAIVATSAFAGCRSVELAHDQDHIRAAVMELHTNQIMDNLIRYRQGLPILQLDYLHMTGTVTDTKTGSLGGTQTLVTNKSLTVPTTALTIGRMFTNVFTWNALATKVNQLTITAEPVTSSPEVYKAYQKFMKDPSHLIMTPEPPPPGQALQIRSVAMCGGESCSHWKHHPVAYYWVPCAYRDEFRELALRAVAMRGAAAQTSPVFEVSVTGYDPDLTLVNPDKRTYRVKITLDKKIPNLPGYMIATVRGARYGRPDELLIDKLGSGDLTAESPDAGDDVPTTKQVYLTFSLKDLNSPLGVNEFLADLTTPGKKVQIYLENYVPPDLTTGAPSDDSRAVLDLIRLQQLQGLSSPTLTR